MLDKELAGVLLVVGLLLFACMYADIIDTKKFHREINESLRNIAKSLDKIERRIK
jgi:hypothetical protein